MTDGGLVKNLPAIPLRDTNVDRVDFGEFLIVDGPQPIGMVDKTQPEPVQYGSYPSENDPNRYDNNGPHFVGNAGVASEAKITMEEAWHPGMTIGINISRLLGFKVKDMDFVIPPNTAVGSVFTVPLLAVGKEWWRGVRKGKLQLLFETGHIDPAITTYRAAKKVFFSDWAKKKVAGD